MSAILSLILGLALLLGAILGVARLLKRFARFNLLDAMLVSFTAVPLLLFAGFYFWACLLARQCGF